MSILDYLEDATKEQCKLRLAIAGPSGAGKTFSGINILMHLNCERIAVIDTEHGSAAKYANEFPRKFKVIDNKYWKSNFDPRRLITVLKELGPHVDGIFVDSLTHFWMGPGGMLTLVDEFAKKAMRNGAKYDSFGAWKWADPIYNELIQTILSLPCHFAAGLRSKTEYEDVVVDGKKKKQKVGMAAQMRDGFEYEFDVEGQLDMDHNFIVGKTRCRALDGKIFPLPGKNVADPLLAWMNDGEPKAPPANDVAPIAKEPSVAKKTLEIVKAAAAPKAFTDVEIPPNVEPVALTPPAPEDEKKNDEVIADMLSQIEKAPTPAALKEVGASIKNALNTKLITLDEYNKILSPAYAKRQKELKGAAAA